MIIAAFLFWYFDNCDFQDSEDDKGALLEDLGSLLVDIFFNLGSNRLELLVNKILRSACSAGLVAEDSHEN